MDITNLGSMSANVQMTADTSDVERAITEMTSKAKSQLDNLGNGTVTSLTQQFKGLTSAVTGGLDAINAGIAKIQNVASLGFLGFGISNIVGQIYQTRQFFQDTESTMTTFFKSADKSKEFISELKDYAYYNMYEFSDLVTVSKQLIAYGTDDTKDIIRVTDQLSNIATGTGANINEMVGIYNKIKARGKADGQVLQQLASRGLVVKDVLKEMGEAVNGNNISFEQFEKVLKHVTDEGGMFHNQMLDQMDNLSASYGQLQDNLTAMYEEMGEELQPVFKEAIDFAGMLVDNYREIAVVLFDLVKAYGIYKVVAGAANWNAESKAKDQAERFEKEKAALEKAAKATQAYANADLQARVAKGELTEEQAKELALIMEGLEKREKELQQIKQQADEEVAAVDKEIKAIEAKIQMQERSRQINYDITKSAELAALQKQKETLETGRAAAAERSEAAAKEMNAIAGAKSAQQDLANAKAKGVLARAAIAAKTAISAVGTAIMDAINPTQLLITAFGFLITELGKAAYYGDETKQAMHRLGEAQDKANKEMGEEIKKMSELYNTLRNHAEISDRWKDAQSALVAMAKEYNVEIGKTVGNSNLEFNATEKLIGKYGELREAIKKTFQTKAYYNFESSEKERISNAIQDYTSKLREQMIDALVKPTDSWDEQGRIMGDIEDAILDITWGLNENAIKGEFNKDGSFSVLGLSEDTLELIGKYQKNIGIIDDFTNSMQGMWTWLKGVASGDIEWSEGRRFQSGKNWVANNLMSLINTINVSEKTLEEARRRWNPEDKPEDGSGGGKEDKDYTKVEYKIEKEKALGKKYIEEYAKLREEQRKAQKKRDAEFENKELQDYKRENLDKEYKPKYSKIETTYREEDLTAEQRETLRTSYENANKAEYDIAIAAAEKLRKDIADYEYKKQKVSSKTLKLNKQGTTPTEDEKKAFQEGIKAEIADIDKQIAVAQAALLGYENAINRALEPTDFAKKVKAYENFAKKYSESLQAEADKEAEYAKEKKKRDKELTKATTEEQKRQILLKQQNAETDLQNFKTEQATQRQILVESFDGTAEDVTALINNLMVDVSKLSFDEIQEKLIRANAKLRQLNVRQQMGEDVSELIAKVTAELTLLEGAAENAKKAMQVDKEDDALEKWKNSKNAISQLADSFKSLGSAIGGSTEEALNMASSVMTTTVSLVDNIVTFTTTSIEAIKTAETAGAKAVKTVEAASVILAVLSAVIQLGHMVANMFNKKNSVDELKDSLHEFNLELEETKRIAAKEDTFKPFNTIFGNDQWGTMLNNIRIGKEAVERYNETVNETIEQADTLSETIYKHGRGFTDASWFTGKAKSVQEQGQYDNIDDTVANMYVKTRHKTWFRNEEGSTLKDFVPSLFGADGKLDKNALHEFVESNNDAFNKLSQDNQDYLKKMDESWQEYQEAVQAVKDTFSGFFGNLGQEIQDVWTNAFRTGQDGLADFEKSWDSAIENMIQSMAYNKTIGKLMNDMENDLDKSGFFENPEGNLGAAIDIMESYEKKAQDTQAAYDTILQEYRDRGYFKDEAAEERKAVSGGITNMTQDTAEEMNGRLTQIQSHTFGISENMKLLVNMQTTQLTILQGIHTDTGQLHGIRADIAELKASVSDIQTRGLKLK